MIASATPSIGEGAILAVDGVHAGYGDVTVLRGVTLEVGPKEVIAVLGANGAGKTTLLRTIAGILPPTEGEIRIFGESIRGVAAHELTRRGIGHVPSGRELFPELSVEDNIMLGALSAPRERRQALRRRVLALFPAVAELLGRPAGRLSGGEQQMVAISRALMTDPRILLLDEPSTGLAPKVVSVLFESLGWLIREEGLTVLLVEQNAKLALTIADRAYVLEQGRCDLSGRAADIAGDPRVIAAYLGYGRVVLAGGGGAEPVAEGPPGLEPGTDGL
jgi:branched-chain amino acid transport system ATP-binding protein